MWKKIIISIVLVLILAGSGFFYWWNGQTDVRELNKVLPEGVRVTKSLFGDKYKVVNKIDGYEFKVPKEWEGVKRIDSLPADEDLFGASGSIISIEGIRDKNSGVTIDYFKTNETVKDLKGWTESMLNNLVGFEGEFITDYVGNLEVIKTQEENRILDNFMYFFKKDSIIYGIVGQSEDDIEYIISNGKWR